MIEQNQFAAASADIVELLTININAVIRKLQRRVTDLMVNKSDGWAFD